MYRKRGDGVREGRRVEGIVWKGGDIPNACLHPLHFGIKKKRSKTARYIRRIKKKKTNRLWLEEGEGGGCI
jgi:hypothetical protein